MAMTAELVDGASDETICFYYDDPSRPKWPGTVFQPTVVYVNTDGSHKLAPLEETLTLGVAKVADEEGNVANVLPVTTFRNGLVNFVDGKHNRSEILVGGRVRMTSLGGISSSLADYDASDLASLAKQVVAGEEVTGFRQWRRVKVLPAKG